MGLAAQLEQVGVFQQPAKILCPASLRSPSAGYGARPTALLGCSEIGCVQVVLAEQGIKIGPVLACELRGIAHVALANLQEADQVAFFKRIFGLP